MARAVALAAVIGVAFTAAVADEAASRAKATFAIGPVRFLTPDFGYGVASERIETDTPPYTRWRAGLFVYRDGRWRNVSPPRLAGLIDDVSFIDAKHGWITSSNCAGVMTAQIYRTVDGGESWRPLVRPNIGDICSGEPAHLSFIDAQDGWLELLNPGAGEGGLYRTSDGGDNWLLVPAYAQLPCLAPVSFQSATTGWMAGPNCGLFVSRSGGQVWTRVSLPVQRNRLFSIVDLPHFFRKEGVTPVTLAKLHQPYQPDSEQSQAVSFATTNDEGRTWSASSRRSIGPCPLRANDPWADFAYWPASIASHDVWWLVGGTSTPVVQVTSDGGRHWRTTVAHGLPKRHCPFAQVTAANADVALAVTTPLTPLLSRGGQSGSRLYLTTDGGRTWRRQHLRLP